MTALVKDRNGSAMSAATDRGHRLDAGEEARVGDLAADRGRCGGQRGREKGASALALATLEVPVRGADRVLSGRELVAIHRDAHRAARLAPLRARGSEDVL